MATDILDILRGPQGETDAERFAQRQVLGPGIAGSLAGILAGSVFGGPVGLAIGLASGLASNRMRQNVGDMVAADLVANDRLSRSVFEQIESAVPYATQFGTEQDLAQLGDIAHSARRLQQLSQHHDPNVRARALEGLLQQDARMDAWRQDIENRTRVEADAMFQVRLDRAKQIQEIANTQFELIRNVEVEADTTMRMLNDLGVESPAVQARLRKLAEMSFTEAKAEGIGVSAGLLGAGLSFTLDDYTFTFDEAVKLITGFREAQTQRRLDIVDQIGQEAEADGFAINLREGQVTVDDLNINRFRPLDQQVEPGPNISAERARAEQARPKDEAALLGTAAGDLLSRGAEAAGSAAGSVLDTITNIPNRAAELLERMNEDRRRRREAAAERMRRRPTN